MKKIIFRPRALHATGTGLEIQAGVELSPNDVSTLVKLAHEPDPFCPVFLICENGHRQHLLYEHLQEFLAEPLAEYRAKLAQEAVELAARQEQARQEAEALRARQEAEAEARERAAKQADAEAVKSQLIDAIG